MSEEAARPPAGLPADMVKARADRGVSKAELAEKLHVHQAAVSMIEAGEMDVEPELGKRIKTWIDSGGGAEEKSSRGPYTKKRTTLPKR